MRWLIFRSPEESTKRSHLFDTVTRLITFVYFYFSLGCARFMVPAYKYGSCANEQNLDLDQTTQMLNVSSSFAIHIFALKFFLVVEGT